MKTLRFQKETFMFYVLVGFAYLLFWLIIEYLGYPDTFLQRSVNTAWRTIYLVIINFLLFEYTLSYARLTVKNVLILSIHSVVHLIALSYGVFEWRNLGITIHLYTSYIEYANILTGTFAQFQIGASSVFFFGIVKLVYTNIKLKQSAQQMLIEKQQAELNYLKSQTNPHFLFNTLNNIYSLTRDKSEQAPEAIVRLSKILRFMLYETAVEYITIEQELNIIKDYIALEQLRYDDELRVTLDCDVRTLNQTIPPLLLMPLVENAFKHGLSETRRNPAINIQLSINQQWLTFTVSNSIDGQSGEQPVKENIGLSNLRRQLGLIYLDHSLSFHREESRFTATMHINLESHV